MELEAGMDFRKPEYRQEVFLRFWEFHLRYRSHPGAVYYVMPALAQHYGWDTEQKLWFAWLNGNTQNPVTSLALFAQGPEPTAPAIERILAFWQKEYPRLAWDTDRRYHKARLREAMESYQRNVLDAGTQEDYWGAPEGEWRELWRRASGLYSMGRLSAWSYLEYVRIMGMRVECDTLLLGDHDGSRSHRNGLCIVSGLDHMDWHHSNPSFNGSYDAATMRRLNDQGAHLRDVMRVRAEGRSWAGDVNYLTLESALCTYKSWHRPNRRYPNVYNDMFHDRIRAAEAQWPDTDHEVFWRIRREQLPSYLLLEDHPLDPGCAPSKQNWYRETGQIVMMDLDWPDEFRNDWFPRMALGQFEGERKWRR